MNSDVITKPFWRSWEFWFGVTSVLIAVLNLFGFGQYQPSQEVMEITLVVTTLVVLIRRLFFTQTKLTL